MSNGAIHKACLKKAKYDELKKELDQLGLYLFRTDTSLALKILNRVKANPELARAFSLAKENGVLVFCDPNHKFDVGGGSVTIGLGKTDDEIVKFLMGE